MNKRKIPAAPGENKIEELLNKIQPVPSENFHQRMKQAAWRTENPGAQTKSANNRHLRLTLTITVLLLLLLITPQGRAWAQEFFQFFLRVNSTTIPLPEEAREEMFVVPEPYELPLARVLTPTLSPEMAGLSECQSAQDVHSYACRVAYAESKLGFNLKEFPAQPEGWEFESLHFDLISKTAYTSYRLDISYNSHSQLLLLQSLSELITSTYPWTAAPTNQIEVVKVGPYNGEYVRGSFDLSNDNSKLIWNASNARQRLAWSDGTRWYFIEFFASSTSAKSMGRDQLIELAASLVDQPIKTVESPNPDFLYSISDAEKISGLDLKAPTLLPLGVEFASAQYLPDSDKVLLQYGISDELVIHEWEGTPTNFNDLSPTSNPGYEIVNVNGRNAFFSFISEPNPYWFLWWSQGELNYQLYYYQYLSPDGGTLTREKMIAIAESMSDINVFRGDTFKPYGYVAIYEQSLGFDAKEFPASPAGWSFTGVSAYAQSGCITISYTAEKEIGWLNLRQCNTEKHFASYDIPPDAIERVKIREREGQYVIGNLEFKEFGKPVWNPDLPFRSLRWQEDGLWLQITLSGDSILLHDKEDLISYAESLR